MMWITTHQRGLVFDKAPGDEDISDELPMDKMEKNA
jgi:hypothetical protein